LPALPVPVARVWLASAGSTHHEKAGHKKSRPRKKAVTSILDVTAG